MKNKHIVLLFLLTLLLGVVARFSPWFKSETLQSDLIRISANDIQRIQIRQPGRAEFSLERGETGWLASAENMSAPAPDSVMAPILAALSKISSIRIIHTQHPDSIWLHPAQAVHVEVERSNGTVEKFDIGREVKDGAQEATYLRLETHDGIYLAGNYLRRLFQFSPADFRNKNVVSINPDTITRFLVCRPGCDTIQWVKIDTSNWRCTGVQEGLYSRAAIAVWFDWLGYLNGLPFAAPEEEVGDDEQPGLRIEFQPDNEEPVWVDFYGYSCTRASSPSENTKTLIHSSRNEGNYFILNNTHLVDQLANGPAAQPASSAPANSPAGK